MGRSLNGIFGWLKVIANNESTGFRDVEMPYRQAVRFKGGVGAALGLASGIAEIDAGDSTGPTGAQGPDGDLGEPGATGAAAAIGLHDTTHSPVGLWQFQGSLADTSGNSFDLSVSAGTETYSAMVPNLRGVKLDGTLRLERAFTSALAITGDLTIEALVLLSGSTDTVANVSQIIAHTYGTNDTLEAYNYIYDLRFLSASRVLTFLSEHGLGGADDTTTSVQAYPVRGQIFHLAVTRASNVISFYCNGRLLAASSALPTPTGGSSGRLYVGGQGGPDAPLFSSPMLLASLKIIPSGLTIAQVQAEYNRTAGKFYGKIL